MAAAISAAKAPRWNNITITGSAMMKSAAAAGKVINMPNSSARFWVARAPPSSPRLTCRDNSGSRAVPIATPITPSGNCVMRSA